jgi:hypothetical protein
MAAIRGGWSILEDLRCDTAEDRLGAIDLH